MKNILIQSIIFIAIAISANAQQQTVQPNNDCTDLFITELTFGKNPKANNAFDLNYAIEIFNSSNAVINLANYSLDLATSAGVISSVPLTGSLGSHDVFVIGNSNADLNLQGLCDQLSGDLEFELNVSLELKKGSNVIDRLGLGGSSIPQSFDVAQFTSDPYGYLQNFHLDLNDYQNIDIRRSILAQHGNPNFNESTDILGQWSYNLNTDRSDIGTHKSLCNRPLGMDYIGYWKPEHYININNSNDNDPLDLNINGSKNGFPSNLNPWLWHSQLVTSTANICNSSTIPFAELKFDPNTNMPSGFFAFNECQVMNFIFPGNGSNSGTFAFATSNATNNSPAFVDVQLNASNSGSILIDNSIGSKNHRIKFGKGALGISDAKISTIKIFPNPANSIINLEVFNEFDYSIVNNLGLILRKGKVNPQNKIIDIATLPNNIYCLVLSNKNIKITTIPFSKN